jgi:hypothetical protein
MFLEAGSVRAVGDVKVAMSAYLNSQCSSPRVVDLSIKPRPAHFNGSARLVRVSPSDTETGWSLPFGQQLSLDLEIDAQSGVTQVQVGFALHSIRGFEVASWTNKCSDVELSVRPGINTFRIALRHLKLLPGRYLLDIDVWGDRGDHDRINEAVELEITPSPEAAKINAQYFGGAIVPSATISMVG